jgi:TonB-dependent starch-binding outer membrane protein SusC
MKSINILFFILFTLKITAQTVISGQIMSGDEPLFGATVAQKNTARGTTTDIDGKFRLELTSAGDVILVSYTGFLPQEITVGTQRVFNILLIENSKLIDEIVIVGYGSQKRSNISGAVSSITSDEISELPVLRTEQALQGRTAGVLVTQKSGSPGSELSVRIRGTGTIGDAEPLYIVDGVPVSGLDFLNPNDIESINILKDAASAAIYGARGANGVVLITTKTGKKNQNSSISYDAYYGVQSAWKKANLLNAREYAVLSNEAHVAAGQTPLLEFANPDALGEGTDWLGAIFQNAPMSNHQIGFSGGSEKSSYNLSGNVFDQNGIVGGEKAGFRRYTVRANGSNEVRKWLTIGTNIGFTSLTRNGLPENNEFVTPLARALNMDPITPIRKADGTFAYSRYSDTDITNPANAIAQTHDRWHSDRVVGNVFGEFKLARGLTFRSAYSVDATFAKQNIFYPKFDLSNDPKLSDAPGGEKKLVNSVVLNNNIWKNWQFENVATYQKTFASRHNMTVTAGTSLLENRHEYGGGANTNLPSNNPKDAYISNTIDPIASQSSYAGAEENALQSFFGRVNYEFDDKYLFSAAFRADGSSKFGANNRYGYFPSVSAGWILSHEGFWKESLVNFLKLRASIGQNGNDKIGNYGYTTVVFSGQNYTFGSGQNITNGSVALTAANPDLRWETITQADLGIDAEFFNGKMSFTGDIYQKNTSGMLFAAPVPLTAGTAPPIRNVASVENQGLELALNYRNRDRALKYSFGGNISFVNNKVTSLGEGGEPVFGGRVQSANSDVTKTEVGQPIGAFFGFVTDGLFQNNQEIAAAAFQNENTAPGDIRFKDLDADGKITTADQTYIGNPTPKFTYGGTFDLEFKGFDLGVFLQGSHGNDIYNATVRYDFNYVNRPNSVLKRWTGPGTSNSEPRVNIADPNQNARVSDRFVESGAYLRLKNVQIGYAVPKSLLKKGHFQKLRFYVSAQNLFTVTKYSGMDPEIGAYGGALNAGIDRGFYPQARVYLGGVSLVF